MKRWQAFVQLREVAPDGHTRWHSLCRPAPTEALARGSAKVWLLEQRLRELCDVDSSRTDPCGAPLHYFADVAHSAVRVAVFQVEDFGVACRDDVPHDAFIYLEPYPTEVQL